MPYWHDRREARDKRDVGWVRTRTTSSPWREPLDADQHQDGGAERGRDGPLRRPTTFISKDAGMGSVRSERQLVLLDLDGTLIDRDAAFATACARFVDRHNLGSGAVEWLMTLDGGGYTPRADVARALLDRHPELEDGAHELDALLARGGAEFVALAPDVNEAMLALRAQGRLLVVVTNGPTAQQEEKLARSGLTELVDAWAISEAEGVRKPDPGLFHVAAAKVGLTCEGAWMIGDSADADIVGGSAAGCRTMWISRGREWPGIRPHPTRIVDDVVAALAAIG
jgi:putative hydrolase of the HAD superfamily